MNKFCYSCGAPLSMPEFQGPVEDFCKHCVDEQGDGMVFKLAAGHRLPDGCPASGFVLASDAEMG